MPRLRVNAPSVVHQTIDGETVIINLERGIYYSLDRAGVDVWAGIDAGMEVDALLALVSGRWAGENDRIRASVLALIEDMKQDALIVEDPAGAPGRAVRLETGQSPSAAAPPFEPPVLRRYTDLQDLLLLDPIHQVDEAGWPERSHETPGERR